MDSFYALLSAGADVNAQNAEGETPIFTSIRWMRTDFITPLVQKGGNINAKNLNGETPLAVALFFQSTKLVQALLDNKANSNSEDIDQEMLKRFTGMPLSARPGFEPPRSLPSAPYLTPAHLSPREPAQAKVPLPRNIKGIQGEAFLCIIRDDSDQLYRMIRQGLPPNTFTFDGESLLHAAAANNSLNCLNSLIKSGADLNLVTQMFMEPPIHIAIQEGLSDIFFALLDHGANIDIPNCEGENSLFVAIRYGRLHMVKALIKKSTNLNIVNLSGLTPVQVAILLHETSIVKELISHGANLSFGYFNTYKISLDANEIEICDQIRAVNPELAKNAFAAINNSLPTLPQQGFVYIKTKNFSALRKLLSVRYDLNTPDIKEGLPLLVAIEIGCLQCIKVLVNSGADVDMVFKDTPLISSIKSQKADIIDYMMSTGASLHRPNSEGETPLFAAVRTQNDELIVKLIEKGASPNVCNMNNMSPLYIAVGLKHIPSIKALLNGGADPNSTGLSPLKLAQDIKATQIVNTLINSGAKSQIKRAPRKSRQVQSSLAMTAPIKRIAPLSVEDGKCCVCNTKQLMLRLIPCGHAVVCRRCLPVFMDEHNQCPLCSMGFYATSNIG